MKKLKDLEAAATRYLSRYSRKQFFSVFVVITAANYWLAYNVDGYKSIWLAMIGGWFFGMTFAPFHSQNNSPILLTLNQRQRSQQKMNSD